MDNYDIHTSRSNANIQELLVFDIEDIRKIYSKHIDSNKEEVKKKDGSIQKQY